MRPIPPILRKIAARTLVYAGLCLIVIFALVDLGGPNLRAPAGAVAPMVKDSTPGWPQLRGPRYDARSDETGLADAWPAGGPPVLWMTEIGAGYSGLIAKDGRVYTQAQALAEQCALALDADTGRTIWTHSYGWPYQAGGMFPGPRSTPTWFKGRIYFASPNGLVGCLDAADGRPLWTVDVLKKFAGQGASFGYASSPVVEDDKVILPVGGPTASVVALDAATGETRWTAGAVPASYSSPLPITLNGRRLIAVFLKNTLSAFDLQTGRLLWEQAYSKGFEEHAAALLYDEPRLYAIQAYRAGADLYELEAEPPKHDTGVPGCRIKRIRHDAGMSNDVASSVMIDGFVYGFDLRDMQASGGRPSRGTFRCVDFKTGEVRWSSDKPGHAALLAADGKLLMLSDRGEALLIRANPDHYEELGRAAVFPGEICWTAPALHDGRLFLRSPTRAACLYVGKPERMNVRQRASAAPLAAVPKTAPADLRWLVGAEREYAFELPDARELKNWYSVSLLAFAAAAGMAGLAHLIVKHRPNRWSTPIPTIVLWGGLVVFGVIATPLANRISSGFIFTWPLALLAVHQLALAGVWRAKRRPESRAADWAGLAGAVALILACLLYFKLTRRLNLSPTWHFLLMLPAAWPLAVPAARRLGQAGGLTRDIACTFAVFSVHFWSAGGVMLLRTAMG